MSLLNDGARSRHKPRLSGHGYGGFSMLRRSDVSAFRRFVVLAFLILLTAHGSWLTTAYADDTVIGSPHDLSCFAPGPVRAIHEEQVCVFCHVPHTTSPQKALWRRNNPELYYRIYQSSTTDARIDQPSGVSKMCLSCHDGLMALGMTGNAPTDHPTPMTRRFLPPGKTNLTNDLSDDHPIGFRYDRALARRDPQLRSPDLVSRTLPMGKHNEVHCTACHDPHNNRLGDFLRIPDRQSALCLACHDLKGWPTAAHALSRAPTTGRRVDPSERMKYATVADNGCVSCHKIHSAPHSERLLRFERDEDNCLNCHDGSVAVKDILSQLRKSSSHRGDVRVGVHDPIERERVMPPHVVCVDCHNPHAAHTASLPFVRGPGAVLATGSILGARGVDQSGRAVKQATFAYEICLRCHSDNPRRERSRIARQVTETNTRLEFQTSNASFHPVFGSRLSSDVVSLLPPLRKGVVLTCTDCHNSDDSVTAANPLLPNIGSSAGVSGPHGSRFAPLLANQYETRDFTIESAQAYALCYRCHDRTSILADQSFPLHRLHIVVARTPCSACHDPHGVRNSFGSEGSHTNLINFNLAIVRPVATGVGLSAVNFTDTGRTQGNCTLTCHGVDHIRTAYGAAAAAVASPRRNGP